LPLPVPPAIPITITSLIAFTPETIFLFII